jgi:hypothetical protein
MNLKKEDDFNFKFVGFFETPSFIQKLATQPESIWDEYSFRQNNFTPHKKTKTILIVGEDWMVESPEQLSQFEKNKKIFETELINLHNFFIEKYKKGNIVRCILTNLMPHSVIPPHNDGGMSLMNSKRHHIPILTKPEVEFEVGGEIRHLQANEVWEINNFKIHSVRNYSSYERIHLIVDWKTEE